MAFTISRAPFSSSNLAGGSLCHLAKGPGWGWNAPGRNHAQFATRQAIIAFPRRASSIVSRPSSASSSIVPVSLVAALDHWMQRKREVTPIRRSSQRMVPVVGLEPTRPLGHKILSLARLPISPHRHVWRDSRFENGSGTIFCKGLFVFLVASDAGAGERLDAVEHHPAEAPAIEAPPRARGRRCFASGFRRACG